MCRFGACDAIARWRGIAGTVCGLDTVLRLNALFSCGFNALRVTCVNSFIIRSSSMSNLTRPSYRWPAARAMFVCRVRGREKRTETRARRTQRTDTRRDKRAAQRAGEHCAIAPITYHSDTRDFKFVSLTRSRTNSSLPAPTTSSTRAACHFAPPTLRSTAPPARSVWRQSVTLEYGGRSRATLSREIHSSKRGSFFPPNDDQSKMM